MAHNLRENNNKNDYRKIIIKSVASKEVFVQLIAMGELTLIIRADA